jgi:predicted  nucleic acid-binding Zn-ribbon protein
MAKKTNLLDKAKQFLQSTSAKVAAFQDRESEIKKKLAQLEAEITGLTENYDPTKPFDAGKVDELEAKVKALRTELSILQVQKQKAPKHEIDVLVEQIEGVRTEADSYFETKKQEEEKARQAILEAKQAFLSSLQAHRSLIEDANLFKVDANETLDKLAEDIRRHVSKLREEAQLIGLQISRMAGTGAYNGPRSNQSEIDALHDKQMEIYREISRLEPLTSELGLPIGTLESHTDRNMKAIYFVHADEQRK